MQTKIQNKYNNEEVLQMQKHAAESQNKYINSKPTANIEMMWSQKHTNVKTNSTKAV